MMITLLLSMIVAIIIASVAITIVVESSVATKITVPDGEFIGYPSYQQAEAFIDRVAAVYPDISKVEQVGISRENRGIRALCIGFSCKNPSDVFIPQSFYNALHHSREPLGLSTLMYFIKDIFDKYEATSDSYFLKSRELWFVLVVNPDGYEWNRINYPNGGGMQRKNRSPGCKEPEKVGTDPTTKKYYEPNVGVDLNRNYDFCFDKDNIGSSKDPCREDYEGPTPFSEPESVAIRDFILKNNFTVAFNYHSFGKALYIPYSCRPKGHIPHSDDIFFESYAKQLTRINHYTWGQPWNKGLYSVNGDAADWMYYTKNIFAVSPEVAPKDPVPSDAYGFWPPKNMIYESSMENLHMNYRGAWASGVVFGVEQETASVELISNHSLILTLSIKNQGLRDSYGAVQISASIGGRVSTNVVEKNGLVRKESENMLFQEMIDIKSLKTYLRSLLEPSGSDKNPKESLQSTKSLINGKTMTLAIRDSLHCEIYEAKVNVDAFKESTTLNYLGQATGEIVIQFGPESKERISSTSKKCQSYFTKTRPLNPEDDNDDEGKGINSPCSKDNITQEVSCEVSFSKNESIIAVSLLVLFLMCGSGFVFFRAYERQYLWDRAKRLADGTSDRGGKGFVKVRQAETTSNATPVSNFPFSSRVTNNEGTKIQIEELSARFDQGNNDAYEEDEIVINEVSRKTKDDFSLVREAKIMTNVSTNEVAI